MGRCADRTFVGRAQCFAATGTAFCVLVSAGGACYIVDTHKHAQAGMLIATMDYEPVALAQFLWHTLLPELGCRPQLDLCLSAQLRQVLRHRRLMPNLLLLAQRPLLLR